MSTYLIQAPDSKVWHIGRFVYDHNGPGTGQWLPNCNLDPTGGPWRLEGSSYVPLEFQHLSWRTPHGICSNCAREVESAVRLIATEVAAG